MLKCTKVKLFETFSFDTSLLTTFSRSMVYYIIIITSILLLYLLTNCGFQFLCNCFLRVTSTHKICLLSNVSQTMVFLINN